MILTQRNAQTAFKDLIESDFIDLDKLKQYAQKKSIVAEFKPLCWKILLGVKSPYRDIRQYINETNCQIYQRIHSTLTTCRIIDETTPLNQQFLAMFLLDSYQIHFTSNLLKDFESFLSICNFICSFFDHDNSPKIELSSECWFVTCAIYERFLRLSRRASLIRSHVNKFAQQGFLHEPKLLLHLNTNNIFFSIPDQWLKDGFQLIRDELSLSNIWEKFFAGCEFIFVFLIIQILHHCRQKLLSFYTTKEILQYLSELKIDDQASCEHIVIASIASWKKQGDSQLDLPVINN